MSNFDDYSAIIPRCFVKLFDKSFRELAQIIGWRLQGGTNMIVDLSEAGTRGIFGVQNTPE